MLLVFVWALEVQSFGIRKFRGLRKFTGLSSGLGIDERVWLVRLQRVSTYFSSRS